MLVQAGVEIGDVGLKVGDQLLLVGDLLLLVCQNVQEHAHNLAHRVRRDCPFVWSDTSRWCVALHATSMPGAGAAVK